MPRGKGGGKSGAPKAAAAPKSQPIPAHSDPESSDAESQDEGGEAPKYVQRDYRGALMMVSPLEARFSQWKVRHTFWDGALLSAVAPSIKAEPCTAEEAALYGATWRLEAPFPTIEVARWRCKLRDPKTGRPKVDKQNGKQLYDPEMRWFTLDNRRLYCLQVAAITKWPDRCIVEVSEVPGEDTCMRELRKLRTMDCGKSLMIGSTADQVPFESWSWRAEVGVGSDCEDAGESATTSSKPAEVKSNTFTKPEAKAATGRRKQKGGGKGYANSDAWDWSEQWPPPQAEAVAPELGNALGAQLLGLLKGTPVPQIDMGAQSKHVAVPSRKAGGKGRKGKAKTDESWWQSDSWWQAGAWNEASEWW